MKKVLFVCIHNSGRSQMAEVFFNHYANGKFEAASAGTNPARSLNPVVVKAMSELGYDLSRNNPKLLTPEMAGTADRIITMGCLNEEGVCPALFLPTEDWALADPRGKSPERVRDIRDEIRRRVLRLIEELDR
jgi:arsenate reductase (thioredoxin)